MSDRYGASPETWRHYSQLGFTADMLPVVSNPDAKISELSKMQALGKTPSFYNADRKVIGFPKWTDFEATPQSIRHWQQQPDYGICLQTRQLGAIDIDVPDKVKARAIVEAINLSMPMRHRADSGKCLLAFRRSFAMPKRVIPVDGGMIEFLGDGQQFIAEGQHPDGERYQWCGDIGDAPGLTEAELDGLWLDLVSLFATGEPRIARQKRQGQGSVDLAVHDPVADWLNENWEVYDVGSDGQLFIECPFHEEHTSDSGPTATAYFPAGTGGYSQGHYVCLHAHCAGRLDGAFNDATGYSLAQFDDLTSPAFANADPAGGAGVDREGRTEGEAPAKSAAELAGLKPWPTLVRSKTGIKATADNLVKIIERPDIIFRHLAYDNFRDELMWAPSDQPRAEAQWRPFADTDYITVRIELERRGFEPMGKELLREAVAKVASEAAIDSAQEWISRLTWDGVERVERFTNDCWGWDDTEYSRAVSRYVWSALAGRVMQPGVRADMAPILVGNQGARKTTALQAMAPHEDFYTEIKLDAQDDNTSRRLRGKLVAELEELRGLNSRAIEEIKAFITRRRESWVPKFKEFENHFWRRVIFFGSTNEEEILNDPTGERRWLPGWCRGQLDIARIQATRDQLWAEGAMRFTLFGVEWQDAERLAPVEHAKFKVADSWHAPIVRWLNDTSGIDGKKPDHAGFLLAADVLSGAILMPVQHQDKRAEVRVAKVMKMLGWSTVRLPIHGENMTAFVRQLDEPVVTH